MNCKNCKNFKQINRYSIERFQGQYYENYKFKLPKVTRDEVGMKFYKLHGNCSLIQDFYGIEFDPACFCQSIKCGSIDCIIKIMNLINKHRGY